MMPRIVLTMLAVLGLACQPALASGWLENFAAAKAAAKATGRPILADFAGSDWCPLCIKLTRDVFTQPAFQAYASTNLVLFLADFPESKEQAPQIAEQNMALKHQYHVVGCPTVLLLDADGAVLAQTGYLPGGAEAYVIHLQDLLKQAGWKQAGAAAATTNQPAATPAAAAGKK